MPIPYASMTVVATAAVPPTRSLKREAAQNAVPNSLPIHAMKPIHETQNFHDIFPVWRAPSSKT